MEMGQAAGAESDVARKAKMYYSIIRQFQNYHMALEKVKIKKPDCYLETQYILAKITGIFLQTNS